MSLSLPCFVSVSQSLSSPTLLHQAFAYSSTNKILHDQRVTNRILKNNFQKVLQTANVKAWRKKKNLLFRSDVFSSGVERIYCRLVTEKCMFKGRKKKKQSSCSLASPSRVHLMCSCRENGARKARKNTISRTCPQGGVCLLQPLCPP